MKLGLGGAMVLALGGGAVALFEPGLRGTRLATPGKQVFRSVARAFLDGALPTDPTQHQAALSGFLDRVDSLVGALPAHARDELSQLLALLATTAGRRGLAGLEAGWQDASIEQLHGALQSMRTSSLAIRQQAYHALHDITGAAYFSEASTWSILGYPGPVAV
ncbi:MAG: hypothetical protein ACJ8GO_01070 [Ramlibacter sp.]